MDEILHIYKRVGETPLEAIERFKADNPRYEEMPMTYTGRLDPIADGVLLVLAGDEVHKKEEYLSLDKEYVAHVLLGFSSDSYDVLGLAKHHVCEHIQEGGVERFLHGLVGSSRQTYPPFSSKPVGLKKGDEGKKPLWAWAREGKLGDIERPNKDIHIYNASLVTEYSISNAPLYEKIEGIVSRVNGDFRQGEILERWRYLLQDDSGEHKVLVLRFKVSSGTYIRSLAHRIGKELGCGAVLLQLTRTAVGDITLSNTRGRDDYVQ